MSDTFSIKDLIQLGVEQKPVEFDNVFNGLAIQRLQQAVELRKQEMAKNMFNVKKISTNGDTDVQAS